MARSQVKGVRQTARAIRSMSNMRRPVSEASRFALQPILAKSKQNLATHKPGRYIPGPNVVSGTLMRSMAIRQIKASRAKQETVVGATGKGIGKAHLVEFGTDPHWQPKRNQMHPGAQPFPFLTPAYFEHDDEAVARFGVKIGDAVERHARRVAAKINKGS